MYGCVTRFEKTICWEVYLFSEARFSSLTLFLHPVVGILAGLGNAAIIRWQTKRVARRKQEDLNKMQKDFEIYGTYERDIFSSLTFEESRYDEVLHILAFPHTVTISSGAPRYKKFRWLSQCGFCAILMGDEIVEEILIKVRSIAEHRGLTIPDITAEQIKGKDEGFMKNRRSDNHDTFVQDLLAIRRVLEVAGFHLIHIQSHNSRYVLTVVTPSENERLLSMGYDAHVEYLKTK